MYKQDRGVYASECNLYRNRCRGSALPRFCVGRYTGSGLGRYTGEVLDFQCRPTLKGVVAQLEKVRAYFGGLQLIGHDALNMLFTQRHN